MMRGQGKKTEQEQDVGTSRKKVGGQVVMPIGARCKHPCHAKKRKKKVRGKSEMEGIRASSFVKGGCCKLL